MEHFNRKFKEVKYGKRTTSRAVATHQVQINIIDKFTGEIENSFTKNVREVKSKKGWCKMYPKDMADAMLRLKNRPLAISVYFYLMRYGYFKKDGTIKNFKQSNIAKEIDSNPSTVSRAIKVLKQEELIEQINDEWRYNPYLATVSGQSEAELYEAQRIWEEWIGYYEFKDGKNQSKHIE